MDFKGHVPMEDQHEGMSLILLIEEDLWISAGFMVILTTNNSVCPN